MSPTTRLVGKTSAALGAATGQDLAAVGSSHSLAEAVNLGAMQLLGLIGTFRCHVETPPVRIPVATLDDTYSTPYRDPIWCSKRVLKRHFAAHRLVYIFFLKVSTKTLKNIEKTCFFHAFFVVF